MIERVRERFELPTKKLIGDTAYGTAEFLNWLVNEQQIEPHVPVWEKAERTDGTFSRSAFVFDDIDDSYTCPNGKQIRPRRRNFKQRRSLVTKAGYIIYRASKHDCTGSAAPERSSCSRPPLKTSGEWQNSWGPVRLQFVLRPDFDEIFQRKQESEKKSG